MKTICSPQWTLFFDSFYIKNKNTENNKIKQNIKISVKKKRKIPTLFFATSRENTHMNTFGNISVTMLKYKFPLQQSIGCTAFV